MTDTATEAPAAERPAKTFILHPGDKPALHLDRGASDNAQGAEALPQLTEIIRTTCDFIESEFRRVNPDAAPGTPVCAGCALDVPMALVGEMLVRAGATRRDAIEIYEASRNFMDDQLRHAKTGGRGGDKLHDLLGALFGEALAGAIVIDVSDRRR